jgi:DNA-binding IscR family transcriptional regulator
MAAGRSRPATAISFADVIRAIDGTLVNVAGTRPEKLSFPGSAGGLKTALIAVRAAEREVLESISLADGVSEQFPPRVQELLQNPNAWH